MQYGINLGVNYKGFDLSVLLQGVGKRDVWISDARRWPFNSGQFGSLFKDQLDYWKPVDSANISVFTGKETTPVTIHVRKRSI